MKQSLQELNSLARILASIFKDYTPVNLFENYVGLHTAIFKNYNKDQIGFPKDLKKPFGYKAILESFAKSLGFNTYEGLKNSGQSEFELNVFTSLKALNPFYLNPFYTDMWAALTVCLVGDFVENPITEKLALGFKKDARIAEYLRLTGGLSKLIAETIEQDRHEVTDYSFLPLIDSSTHYYVIAVSMYSYAIAKNKVLTEDEDIFEQYDSLTLREYVTFSDWGNENLSTFIQGLTQIMRSMFGVKVEIIDSEADPLDTIIILRHMHQDLEYSDDWKVGYHLELDMKNIRVNQEALIKIAPSIQNDKNLYSLDPQEFYIRICVHNHIKNVEESYWERTASYEKGHWFLNEFRDIESLSERGMQGRQGKSLIGTKMYILNLMRYEHTFKDEKHKEAVTVDDVLYYWKNNVLENLIALDGRLTQAK
jgi:hypothetical protein